MGKLHQGLLAMVTAAIVAIGIHDARAADQVVGTIVRFTAGETAVDVTIGEDNPTVRDLLARLPLTMKLEEYAGREKIGYFSPKLAAEGSPGSDPEDGDLIYFVPWGNIGFYYDASGVGYSDQTIHIGKYMASPKELEKLVGGPVRIEIVN